MTPAKRALVQLSASPIDWRAELKATSADEQAVSTDTHSPCIPRTYESRPDAKQCPVPVREKAFLYSDASVNSTDIIPMNTPIFASERSTRVKEAPCNAPYPASSSIRC